MKTKLIFLILFLITELCHAQKLPSLIPYRKGDLWGFSDSAGRILVRPQFDKPGRGEGDFGFVDYDSVHFIYNKDGKLLYKSANSSLIDSLAEREIQVSSRPAQRIKTKKLRKEYAFFEPYFDEGVIIVGNGKTNRKFGIIDTLGKILIPIIHDSIQIKDGKYMRFVDNGISSDYCNFQGKFAYKYFPESDSSIYLLGSFMIKAKGTEGACLYNRFGKIISDTFNHSKMWIMPNNNDAIIKLVMDHVPYYALIDVNGKIKIPFSQWRLKWAGNVSLWRERDDEYTNLVDLYGKILMETKYDNIIPVDFYEHKLFWADSVIGEKNSGYCIVDSLGNKLSQRAFFTAICVFREGLCTVLIHVKDLGMLLGVIDTTGKIIIPFEYQNPLKPQNDLVLGLPHFHNGLMKVKYHNKIIYISRYNRRYYED